MNVEFLMAARARYVYQGQRTLAGMLLAKPDNDPVVQVIEQAYSLYCGANAMTPLDTVERMIAAQVDAGESLPISNPESYQAAQWLAQSGLNSMPDPMPRAFVLYIAKALKDTSHYSTVSDALNDILTTKHFV